jgi:hypothetical protein
LRESIHRWLSPPDPSTNHNIACDTHHKKTAKWFFEGNIYQEWKSKGSLLWIHGKRALRSNFHPIPLMTSLLCSWLRQEYSLVRASLALSITDYSCLLSVPRSSKILRLCARLVKDRWHTFTSTFETPTSKAYTIYSLPFSPNFLLAQPPAAIFYPDFIRITTTERCNLVTAI